jgi:predicted RNase H-like HicB family nuclease
MMRYMVVVERGETSWGAHVPDLPGCIAVGETRDEALELIREAIELHIEGLRQDGLTVPAPSSESEFVEVSAAERRLMVLMHHRFPIRSFRQPILERAITSVVTLSAREATRKWWAIIMFRRTQAALMVELPMRPRET